MYVPAYTLAIEAGRMRVSVPWESEDDRIRNMIPVFYPISEDEKKEYLAALDDFLRFADALDEYALTEDIEVVREAWKTWFSHFNFLSSFRDKVMKEYEKFEERVGAFFKARGQEGVKSPIAKLLAYLKLTYDEAKDEEKKEEIFELAERIILVIDDYLKNLEENLPEELPEQFSSFEEVVKLSEELISTLDAFLEEGKLELLEEAIKIALKLEPVSTQLQMELTRAFTDFSQPPQSDNQEGGEK